MGMALRKHEVLELKIDWLTNKMIIKRLAGDQGESEYDSMHTMNGQRQDRPLMKDIVLNLKRKDMLQREWFLNCSVCVNDIESFMWNLENDKDYISYTVLAAYIS